MAQVKNKFDKKTVIKIGKGALWAISGFVGASIPIIVSGLPLTTWWGAGLAWLLPTAINAIHEYTKGDANAQPDNRVDTQADS